MNLRTKPQTAKQLAVSVRTVERLISKGHLSVVKVGRSVRISDESINKFCKENTQCHSNAQDRPAIMRPQLSTANKLDDQLERLIRKQQPRSKKTGGKTSKLQVINGKT